MLPNSLKAHLSQKFGIKADATDEDFTKLLGEKLASGELTHAEMVEKSTATKTAENKVDQLIESKLTDKFCALESKLEKLIGGLGAPAANAPAPGDKGGETFDAKAYLDEMEKRLNAQIDERAKSVGGQDANRVTPSMIFSKANEARVKGIAEEYSQTKSTAIVPTLNKSGKPNLHPRAGMPALSLGMDGRELENPSDLDKAVIGAFYKWRVIQQLPRTVDLDPSMKMTDHDWSLIAYAAHNMKWTGYLGDGEKAGPEAEDRRLNELEVKALLDDGVNVTLGGGTSGGALVPLVFDDAIVLTPVLEKQLFPLVDLRVLPRGRRITGAVLSNPTMSWGPAEGGSPSISLQDTTNFVTELDTNIYNVTGAFEIGLDFMEDTPIDIAGAVLKQYGLKLGEQLDYVIASGDGSTQPLGIFNATGTNAIGSVCGESGPYTAGDLEGLNRSIPLQIRDGAGARLAWISNDTTYWRVRAIPQGEKDARRLFGEDHDSYTVMNKPWRVQNSIADGYLACGNMQYYRMWRRRGFTVRVETAGQTLSLKNTQLIVVRARFGGRPVLANAFSVMTNGATADLG